MKKLVAFFVRAFIEAIACILTFCVALIGACLMGLGALIIGVARLYNWSVIATETQEERAAREQAEWKLKAGGTSL